MNLYLRVLLAKHKVSQFLGLKDKNDPVVKIWFDPKSNDTLMFANTRSGLYFLPAQYASCDGKELYSAWLANISLVVKYGLDDKKKNKTIYVLMDTREWEPRNEHK